MNKIRLIISREYLTRVKKKSFIAMTILGPILFAALFIAPAWIASMEDTDIKTIAVIDSSKVFVNKIQDTDYIKFKYLENTSLNEARKIFAQSEYYAILQILPSITYEPSAVHLFSIKQPGFAVKNYISSSMEKELKNQKLRAAGINEDVLKSIKSDVSIRTIQWTEDGKEKEGSTEIAMAVGYASGFLIYFFIFMFGAQVMRGVIEEKSSRIVEIIISSARPFELMMGKIVGVALVGLTQFILWIVLTFAIVAGVKTVMFPQLGTKNAQEVVAQDMFAAAGQDIPDEAQQVIQQQQSMQEFENIFNSLKTVNYGLMIGSFIFFFLGGYLLYGSLFAAIGSAVDNEADTQQFMFPITIPLILGIFVMMNAIQTPDSPVAFWFSIIPFTSPIVMMVRIPFGVPYWEIALSMGLLILTFVFTTWLAGKIYRTGILMYGKKINYKELWKWIRYKY
ncbi:MAG: ABC transporter permease [Bacteroidetes bacterium GWF2_33_16]|nr:MAG: ABC transporter permease [Bacteroidetes bacterium GWE2_32_14]OFY05187.1 MAG: ABC transporter permease [Bacteroidetes bacterium GWF2_33_16]